MGIILKVENINVYYGNIHAIKDVSFEVNEGEIVTLIGANGAGKSSSLNTITGLLRSRTGSIEFDGENISHTPAHKIVSKGLALVPEGRRIFQQMTVKENLDMGAYTGRDGFDDRLAEVYERFPRLKEREKQIAGTLSGGGWWSRMHRLPWPWQTVAMCWRREELSPAAPAESCSILLPLKKPIWAVNFRLTFRRRHFIIPLIAVKGRSTQNLHVQREGGR